MSAGELIKILVVEDELIMRQGIIHILDWKSEGFEVVGDAQNGKDALTLIEQLHPDIVITDIVMPEMDGIQLADIICRKYPNIQIIVVSSYSDFDYVKQSFQSGAVDYILKSKISSEGLLETLRKAAQRLPQGHVEKKSGNGISEKLERYILGFDETISISGMEDQLPYDSYMLIGVDHRKLTVHSGDGKCPVAADIEKHLPYCVSDAVCIPLSYHDGNLICLLNSHQQSADSLTLRLLSYFSKISGELSEALFVCFDSFSELPDLRAQVKKALPFMSGCRFYNRDKTAVTAASLLPEEMEESFDFKRFSKTVELLQFENAVEQIREYIQSCIEHRIPHTDIKQLLKNSLFNLLVALDGAAFGTGELSEMRRELFCQIEAAQYAEDFIQASERSFSFICDVVEKRRETIDMTMIDRILTYIHEHYAESLSLNELAQRFHYNYNYLSSYFSTNVKLGFSEYLNKIRIDEACRLLQESDTPVANICTIVGYSDQSYFCKVFKRYTGCTPSAFRKQ